MSNIWSNLLYWNLCISIGFFVGFIIYWIYDIIFSKD